MIDDIWQSMQEEVKAVSKEVKKKKKTLVKQTVVMEQAVRPQGEVITLLSSMGLAPKGKGKKPKPDVPVPALPAAAEPAGAAERAAAGAATPEVVAVPITLSDLTILLSRDIALLNDPIATIRKASLQRIHRHTFIQHTLSSAGDYGTLFRDIAKPLFKRISDSHEGCREATQVLINAFFAHSSDLVPVLGYYFPAQMRRTSAVVLDMELNLFVADEATHAAYKRGRAVPRADSLSVATGGIAAPPSRIEPSEEVRCASIQTLHTLVLRLESIHGEALLHPYYSDFMTYLAAEAFDSFTTLPAVQQAICSLLSTLCKVDDFQLANKHFAIAWIRMLLPCLRHRLAKVRAAALIACNAIFLIKDTAKCKSAASESIIDLVGFKEENVLPIAAFYTSDVRINYLASLAGDSSAVVKGSLLVLLQTLLTDIADRRDYETRLLPYLLNLLADSDPSIAMQAEKILSICGKQYESEHLDEVLKRKQYAIDGAEFIQFVSFGPFHVRPGIGVRLFVRGNTHRFFTALVSELSTHWQMVTRLRSLRLLAMLLVLCEETLTGDAHLLFPHLLSAFVAQQTEKDTEVEKAFVDVLQLCGRYFLPETYCMAVLPRMRTIDPSACPAVVRMLQHMLVCSKPSVLYGQFDALVDGLIVTAAEVPTAMPAVVDCLLALLHTLSTSHGVHENIHSKMVEAVYRTQGRIRDFTRHLATLFKCFLSYSTSSVEKAAEGLHLLVYFAAPIQGCTNTSSAVHALLAKQAVFLLEGYHAGTTVAHQPLLGATSSEVPVYEVTEAWSAASTDYQLLRTLVTLVPRLLIASAGQSAELSRIRDMHSATIGYLHSACTALLAADLLGPLLGHLVLLEDLLLGPRPSASPSASLSASSSASALMDALHLPAPSPCTDDMLAPYRADLLHLLGSARLSTPTLCWIRLRLLTQLTASVTPEEVPLTVLDALLVGEPNASYRVAALQLGLHLLGSEGKLTPFKQQSRKRDACGKKLLDKLLALLYDGSDEVRMANVHLLTALAAHLPEELYGDLLDVLLKHYKDELRLLSKTTAGVSEYTDSLDVLLRTLCVLDAQAFEQMVRGHMLVNQGQGQDEGEQEVEDAALVGMNALIAHADIIQQLQQQR